MGAHDDAWDRMIRNAQDGKLLGHEPHDAVGAPLILEAAQRSSLRDLYPFTSVNRLCFAEGSKWPFEGLQPAHIEFNPDGSMAHDRYMVVDGPPYGESTVALTTGDVTEAVDMLIELLRRTDQT